MSLYSPTKKKEGQGRKLTLDASDKERGAPEKSYPKVVSIALMHKVKIKLFPIDKKKRMHKEMCFSVQQVIFVKFSVTTFHT